MSAIFARDKSINAAKCMMSRIGVLWNNKHNSSSLHMKYWCCSVCLNLISNQSVQNLKPTRMVKLNVTPQQSGSFFLRRTSKTNDTLVDNHTSPVLFSYRPIGLVKTSLSVRWFWICFPGQSNRTQCCQACHSCDVPWALIPQVQ